MAPEKIKIKDEMLSLIQLEIKNKYGIKVGITNKLVPNLMPKKIMLFIIEIYNIIYSRGGYLKKFIKYYNLNKMHG